MRYRITGRARRPRPHGRRHVTGGRARSWLFLPPPAGEPRAVRGAIVRCTLPFRRPRPHGRRHVTEGRANFWLSLPPPARAPPWTTPPRRRAACVLPRRADGRPGPGAVLARPGASWGAVSPLPNFHKSGNLPLPWSLGFQMRSNCAFGHPANPSLVTDQRPLFSLVQSLAVLGAPQPWRL